MPFTFTVLQEAPQTARSPAKPTPHVASHIHALPGPPAHVQPRIAMVYGKQTASETPRRLDFERESPGEIRWPHYGEFESGRLLPSLLIMSCKKKHKDILTSQESHENIHTEQWEESRAYLPHTLLTCVIYSFLPSMLSLKCQKGLLILIY